MTKLHKKVVKLTFAFPRRLTERNLRSAVLCLDDFRRSGIVVVPKPFGHHCRQHSARGRLHLDIAGRPRWPKVLAVLFGLLLCFGTFRLWRV